MVKTKTIHQSKSHVSEVQRVIDFKGLGQVCFLGEVDLRRISWSRVCSGDGVKMNA
jgi:hypothetical protein